MIRNRQTGGLPRRPTRAWTDASDGPRRSDVSASGADQRQADRAGPTRAQAAPTAALPIFHGLGLSGCFPGFVACLILLSGLSSEAAGQDNRPRSNSVARTTELFGISATGSRLVYVIDVSASTAGAPLRVAKRELWSSIRQLQRTNQLQIVFYNHAARFLRIRGEAPRLYWADDETIRSSRRFVDQAKASGGTNHVDALKIALDMQPDIVFLYTDAQDPQLSDEELARIRQLNGSAVIHAIEFGHGPKSEDAHPGAAQQPVDNFLTRLAQQNGGEYRYIDVNRWSQTQLSD